MKNYKLYILTLILVLASQTLLAIDGWWEKVETKNKPEDRSTPSMDWFTENKVIMFGGFGYYPENRDSLDQTEFWIFDYEQRDWIKSQITLPFTYNKFEKYRYIKGNMVNLFDGTMLASFGELNRSSQNDSSLWTLDVLKNKWELIKTEYSNPSFQSKYSNIDFNKIKDGIFMGGLSHGNIYSHKTKKWTFVQEGCRSGSNEDCVQLSNGKLLKVSKSENFLPYDENKPLEEQVFKIKYFDYDSLMWYPVIKGNEENAKSLNPKYIERSSINVGNGKVMFVHSFKTDDFTNSKYSKTSKLFDFNQLENPVRDMVTDTNGPDAKHRWYSVCKLAKDKVLLYGGDIIPNNSSQWPIIPHQTWVFHIDPSLTDVEYVQIDKKERTKKLVVNNSFEIETLNETLKNHTMTDLLGNPVTDYKIENGMISTKVTMNLPNGTYLFQFELSNREKFTYLLLVNQ